MSDLAADSAVHQDFGAMAPHRCLVITQDPLHSNNELSPLLAYFATFPKMTWIATRQKYQEL